MELSAFAKTNTAARLRAAASRGALSHALILSGAGDRNAAAHYAAAALECTGTDKPCLTCAHCRKVLADIHPDVLTVRDDEHAELSVDVIRGVRTDAFIRPNEAARKVFVLLEAQAMSEQAQNALLKILEEPPAYVVFILLCPSSTGFLPTVLSRATVFSLGEVERETDKDELAAAKEAARAFAVSLASFEDMETVKAAAAFEKDQRLLRDAMPIIQEILGQALRVKCSAPEETEFAEEARLIASKLTKNALLSAVEGLDALMAAAALNANHNLMVTRLCTLLRRQAGR